MPNRILLDGKYTRGFYVGRPRINFPFDVNSDYATITVERDWTQSASVFSPGRLGVDRDPYYSTAYLNTETKPDPTGIGDVIKTVRTFAIVPSAQISYGSNSITKPTIPNEGSAILSVRNFNATSTEIATAVRNNTGFWLSDDRVFSAFVAISATSATIPNATAGTFTLTYKAITTGAIAYNAAQPTVEAALNGLASVIADGLTFTVAMGLNTASNGTIGLLATVGTTITSVTMNVAGLTVSTITGKKSFTVVNSSTTQMISLARVLAVPSHGNVNTNALLLVDSSDDGYVFAAGYWDSYDANTLQLATAAGAGGWPNITYAANYLRTYTPGTTILAARITETFYLPGVTAGITTPADIPITVPNISDADIISAVLTHTGYQPVDFSGPDRWMNGVIWQTTKTEVNFDSL